VRRFLLTNPFEEKIEATYSKEKFEKMREEAREANEKAAIHDFGLHLADLLGDLWSEERGYGEASSARKFHGYEKGNNPLQKK
jgi:hypothetical protein